MKAKKMADYVKRKEREDVVILAARIPVSKKMLLEKKLVKDGIESIQEFINAMVDRYLDEK